MSKEVNTTIDLFEFSDYREFLLAQIELRSAVRGYQTQLSLAAGCKRSFLSQVLHSHVNLTPDHAAGLCEFWNFTEDETDWFMELLAIARAGSAPLRKLCERRLETLQKRRGNLKERLKATHVLPKEAHTKYYSSWFWAAIHISTCIPSFNTATKIAARLGLRESLVRETLLALEKMGLVKAKGDQNWRASEQDIHIPKSSDLNIVNHVNWRQRAIAKIQISEEDSLHYTAVHALSVKDISRIKELLIAAIKETREVVKPSPEEELICVAFDVFRV